MRRRSFFFFFPISPIKTEEKKEKKIFLSDVCNDSFRNPLRHFLNYRESYIYKIITYEVKNGDVESNFKGENYLSPLPGEKEEEEEKKRRTSSRCLLAFRGEWIFKRLTSSFPFGLQPLNEGF